MGCSLEGSEGKRALEESCEVEEGEVKERLA